VRKALLPLLLLAVLSGPKASAEYRAYQLNITDTEKNKSHLVMSTLDHLQYPRFHPLNKNEAIAYVDSWRCKGNMSNFRAICAKPEPASSLAPAPTTAPKPKS
jgi:hypothetical protein